jgi:hypothetical protein
MEYVNGTLNVTIATQKVDGVCGESKDIADGDIFI